MCCVWGRNTREGDAERRVKSDRAGWVFVHTTRAATQSPCNPSLGVAPHSDHTCAHELKYSGVFSKCNVVVSSGSYA